MAEHVRVWIGGKPYSTDSMEYDYFAHHLSQRSVFAPLVSAYTRGDYTGIIADTWEVSDDFREWKFHIRPGLSYEDGHPITAETVRLALTRIAFLLKKRGSNAGVVEHFVGSENITNASSPFEGLRVSNDNIILTFKTPMKDLLDKISFGIYSITHPDDFNHDTGKWTNSTGAKSSGAYRISYWDDHKLQLSKRSEFPPGIRDDGAADEIHLMWDPEKKDGSDLIVGADYENYSSAYDFYGPSKKSNIIYLHCVSWKNPNSPCFEKDNRVLARNRIYKELKKSGVFDTTSFFPLSIPGVENFDFNDSELARANGSVRVRQVPIKSRIHDGLYHALDIAFEGQTKVELSSDQLRAELDPDLPDHNVDIMVIRTGILIEAPAHDIKFMVNSKEGIRLPDPTGRLKEITNRRDFSPQEVNAQLWEDAIIFPVAHITKGIWARRGDFDFSRLNLTQPPIDFSWLGVK